MKSKKLKIIGLLSTLFLGAFLIFFNIPLDASAQLADSPWSMIHGDLRHTGLSRYKTQKVDGTVKWTFETGAGIESSPTIAADGTIYIGSHDNKLYALNPDGTLKWKFSAGKPVYIKEWDVYKGIPSAPTIDKEGNIYFIAPPIYMFALTPAGKEKWRAPVYTASHIGASPVIVSDGTIYIGSESYPHVQPGGPKATGQDTTTQEFGARVYAFYPDGKEKWRYDTNGACLANAIAIASDGTIYASGSDLGPDPGGTGDALFAFNPDGSIKWKFPSERIEGPPAIAKDGTIYIGTKSGKFLAINPDGRQKWAFQTGKGISAIAAIGKDGKIYFGSWDGNFYALSPEGKELWHFNTKIGRDPKIFESPYMETITTSAAISADGMIYFGDIIDTFYALTLNGKEKWRYKTTGGGFVSSPAIGKDGTVYVGSWDKKLYAFGGSKETQDVIKNEKKFEPSKINLMIILAATFMLVLAIATGVILVCIKKGGGKQMKLTKKIIIVIIAVVVILAGVWFYFGWYRTEKQVIARCHKQYVQPQGDYYKARDNFYQCLKNQGGVEGFHGDGRFQWDKSAQ
jgi:outer membrane protein assembly factor BamB